MKYQIASLLAVIVPAVFALPTSQPPSSPKALFERQIPVCCAGDCKTRPTDNPEERNEYLHKQVSEPMGCGDGGNDAATCSVSRLTSHTIGWHADIGGMVPFASLGFGVSESFTTGNSYTCSQGTQGTVCVWARIEHISYNVEMDQPLQDADVCDSQPHGVYRITAPTGQISYYCVHGGACRTDGENYWGD